MQVHYKPSFIRQYKRLSPQLRDDIDQRIAEFTDRANHERLKVHKLKGRLKGSYSFSVNYRVRIVFEYAANDAAVLLAVGDHDIYGR